MKKLYCFIPTSFLVLVCFSSTTAQIINTFAGTGVNGFSGDGGLAISAQIGGFETGVAIDQAGNVYICDGNDRIRKVNSVGIITTFAGIGSANYSGDGGPANMAEISPRGGVATDAFGNVYIADYYNQRIRKVNSSGIISTFAGTGTNGYSGDGGAATNAKISNPVNIAVDLAGNVYIPDYFGNRIRKVNTLGVISTIAGTGVQGFSGDGGPATNAQFYTIAGVAVDAVGNIYVCDYQNYRVRKINTSGIISTFAGTSLAGFSGDGGPATLAQLCCPYAVTTDGAGNVYITDDERIRKINTSGIITTIAGNGAYGYSGDGGLAVNAMLGAPAGVASGQSGDIYIADTDNYRVRYIGLSTPINENELNKENISIRPNPSHGIYTVELRETTRLIITNMLGQEIFNKELPIGKNNIDICDEKNGLYFYTLMASKIYSGKIIKL